MKYLKRHYRDVRDTFEYETSGRSLFIFKWTTVGVNSLGIWLQPFSNDQPYVFFEWQWIKEVQISQSDELIYFVMKDMDAVYDNIFLWIPKFAMKLTICKVGDNGDKALCFPYRADSLNAVLYASDKGYCKVISIE